jgi:hypothetical protein
VTALALLVLSLPLLILLAGIVHSLRHQSPPFRTTRRRMTTRWLLTLSQSAPTP